MAALPLPGSSFHKADMECHGDFGNNLGRIHQIPPMIRIEICDIVFRMSAQTVAPNINCFQGLKLCIEYLVSHLISS